jgi:hypothetical protein
MLANNSVNRCISVGRYCMLEARSLTAKHERVVLPTSRHRQRELHAVAPHRPERPLVKAFWYPSNAHDKSKGMHLWSESELDNVE